MADKKNNAKKNVNTTTDKLAELRARVHKHDVKINIGEKTITIPAMEWCNKIESAEAKLFPEKFSDSVAAAISSYRLSMTAMYYTKQANNESHFGVTIRPTAIIDKIKEIFNTIDNITFFAATYGDNEKFDWSKLARSLVGDEINCVVSAKDMDALDWMFTRLQFFCADIIRDQIGRKTVPEFYQVEMLDVDNVKSWFVPAEYVKAFFDDDAETIIIEDDGVRIRFSKTAPTTEQLRFESDDYCLTSIYDSIKNIMTDYFYNLSETTK